MSKKKKKSSKAVSKIEKFLGQKLSNNLKGSLRKGLAFIAWTFEKEKQKDMHAIILVCQTPDGHEVRSMDAMFVRASAGTMTGMLHAAGSRDILFAKAVITAAEGLSHGNEELIDLKEKLTSLGSKIRSGEVTQISDILPSDEDLNNMSQEEMDDYIKNLLGGIGKKGEA